MADTISFICQMANVKDFVMKFLTDSFPQYQLHNLTNGNTPETPNITSVHPLVMEYMQIEASGDNEHDSILPAMSVEETNKEDDLKTIGLVEDYWEVTTEFLDSLKYSDITTLKGRMEARIRDGFLINDNMIEQIEEFKNSLEQKVYAKRIQRGFHQNVVVVIWASSIDVRDIVTLISEAILSDARKTLQGDFRVKDLTMSVQSGLYSTEFGRIFYGAEISLRFINGMTVFKLDMTEESQNDLAGKGINEIITTLNQEGNNFVKKS